MKRDLTEINKNLIRSLLRSCLLHENLMITDVPRPDPKQGVGLSVEAALQNKKQSTELRLMEIMWKKLSCKMKNLDPNLHSI